MTAPQTPPCGGVSVQFYHLTTSPLERALPKLLEKALASGFRALLVASSEERVEQLNQLLWTYDPGSFLPHGSAKDGNSKDQPILIVSSSVILGDAQHRPGIHDKMDSRIRADARPENDANLLVVTDGSTPREPQDFERILDLFDGSDEQAVAGARARWKSYKDAGHSVTYLSQNAQGGWEQKAAA